MESCEQLRTHLVSCRLPRAPICEQDPKAFPCVLSARDDILNFNNDIFLHSNEKKGLCQNGWLACHVKSHRASTKHTLRVETLANQEGTGEITAQKGRRELESLT